MTFLDLFAGVGGFRRGMELAGHKCLGFCEWDKYARMSYISMHCITDEQRAYLATLDYKQRQKEILKSEYLNGEWCSDDIRAVDAGNIPKADCWCFGAPCQDFSLAGKRKGLEGDRSSLIREIFRILGEIREEDKPEWLIYENVKGMLSSNKGFDFLSILLELDVGGYDIEWQLLNSKLHGVPQNRERVYTIGHLRARGCSKIFPLSKTHGTNINNIIDVKQIGKASRTNRDNLNQYRVYDVCGVGPALNCMNGGGRQPHILMECKQGQYRPFLSKKSTGFLYELHDGCNVQAIWNDHINNCICIRKLTPRECFRLQGWTDDYFEKAQFVNSDSQLYKQAGNGVTVNVVYEIAKKMTKEAADE